MKYYIDNQNTENPNNPELFNKLTTEEKTELIDWINHNFQPIKSFTSSSTSYGLKQRFDQTHFYIYNGVFKGAMIAAGYNVKNPNAINWVFNISKKSNFFKADK